MDSTTTMSLPHDKSVLLSSVECRVADLKAELGVQAKDVTGDESDLDLEQFLVETKDEDKEHLFADQIDEGSLDAIGQIIQS